MKTCGSVSSQGSGFSALFRLCPVMYGVLSAHTQKITPDEQKSRMHLLAGQDCYLKTLCEQAGDHDAFDENMTKAEASKCIDELRAELGL